MKINKLMTQLVIFSTLLSSVSVVYAEEELSFADAKVRALHNSYQLDAAKSAVDSKTAHEAALRWIGGPSLRVTGSAGRYSMNTNIDTSKLQQSLSDIGQGLSQKLDHEPFFDFGGINLPDHYQFNRRKDFHSAKLVLYYPLYSGGMHTSIKNISSAQKDQSIAEEMVEYHQIYQQLVKRYFVSSLASLTVKLRQESLNSLENHQQRALRMLNEGVIARVEQLKAEVALEEGKRELEKATNNASLAMTALQSLLKMDEAIAAKTSLFIHSQPLEDLDYFLELAMDHQPVFAKINAKKKQAQSMHHISGSRWKPKVSIFGAYQLKGNNPNWLVGANAHWTLFSSIDRRQMGESTAATVHQVGLLEEQAREDIRLLIEKNWHELNNARVTFLSMRSNLELAEEYLKLQELSFKEGMGTLNDLIDAQLNLNKVKTERANAANDYVQALIGLLKNCGVPERFEEYMQKADIRINS